MRPARRGGSCLQHDAHKRGQLQGTRKGLLLAASPAASRGGAASRWGGHHLAGRLPTGKGSRRLCWARAATTVQKGKEGLGHPLEKRMTLPL
ncbi:hypothetical protein GW17_00054641 [Ensete ventricosum]|uniref:Uncharacterized protein n=1 Tax=Ensete ventricosum TaxID=4639 RepID=A0A444CCU2_ENSVE|nr:hypothetical protein GW17_00054641 [Ensete ventricosum]RZR72948.1 hypothetical protein BHM03_00018744 [Ensete ventricosum]